jgi:CheY-like chemotaxis protein
MARILLINDEPDLLQMCQMVLESEGHSAEATTVASRAVELATKGVDLVLLDLVMPGTTGELVLRMLRESLETREIPIVIMSALADAPERAKAMGADAFLGKPFTPASLLEAIDRALASTAARTPPKSKPAGNRARQAEES